jgi:adenylate kinase
MTFAKLVLVGALSAFALTAAQAAPRAVPASSIAADSAIELVAAKKKVAKKKVAKKKVAKKKVAKKGKKVAKVGPGKCGTMKYWNKKTKKCASKG